MCSACPQPLLHCPPPWPPPEMKLQTPPIVAVLEYTQLECSSPPPLCSSGKIMGTARPQPLSALPPLPLPLPCRLPCSAGKTSVHVHCMHPNPAAPTPNPHAPPPPNYKKPYMLSSTTPNLSLLAHSTPAVQETDLSLCNACPLRTASPLHVLSPTPNKNTTPPPSPIHHTPVVVVLHNAQLDRAAKLLPQLAVLLTLLSSWLVLLQQSTVEAVGWVGRGGVE
jgi:hypothetical protein